MRLELRVRDQVWTALSRRPVYAKYEKDVLSACNLAMIPGHSDLKRSAPVSEPSPPQTTNASIPSLMRLCAAAVRPSMVRNAADRAVPISVPPYVRGGREQVANLGRLG